jgi:hypothetical protein
MTNRRIIKKYVCVLLQRLRNSPDQSDREVYNYLLKTVKKLPGVDDMIRRMGESPSLHWKHNVKPVKLKSIIKEANKKRRDTDYTRSTLLKMFAV